MKTPQAKKIEKIQFICEDIVAEQWSKNLLNGTDLKEKIEVITPESLLFQCLL